jgi:DNA-binding transcriptional ArsR family regulator
MSRKKIQLDRACQALSDPVRIGIVVQLFRQGECSCAELDGGRPKSTMSHHFRVLREAGLVHTRVDGVTHINRLCRDEIEADLPGFLDAVIASADRAAVAAEA